MTAMKRLITAIADEFDAAVIVTETNRRYFTGFHSSNGILIISKKGCVFITDSRYTEAAKKAAANGKPMAECEIIESVSGDDFANILKRLEVKTACLERSLTVERFESLQGAAENVKFTASKGLMSVIAAMRVIKTAEEIETIKAAAQMANDAFSKILEFIKPGVSEKEIALTLDCYMRKNGADGNSFDTIAVSGKNTSLPHGVPSDKIVESGEFVTMDFGVLYNGYCSDMTRTVAVGKPSDEMVKIYDTVLTAHKNVLKVVKDGTTCKQADFAARDYIAGAGYGDCFRHSTGHGVGLDIHELPNLSPLSPDTLRSGMVVTDEPGIYLDGKFGVRIEDMLLVTDDGSQSFSIPQKDLIIL